jgi:hypothetical protein
MLLMIIYDYDNDKYIIISVFIFYHNKRGTNDIIYIDKNELHKILYARSYLSFFEGKTMNI